MDNRFFNIIDNNLKLSTQETIVIAYSGGIDSSCLLDLFKKKFQSLIIAHFNHGLRENASRDEDFSRNVAERLNLKFRSESADVSQYASEMGFSIEEAARKLRYQFLFRISREYNAKYIAVAHHADDQVETVLMHLFRGSGLSGLAGMQEKSIISEFDNSIQIIRPLLTFWRSEIEEYCELNQISYVTDETNIDNTYTRNRLRNEIIPKLNLQYPGLNERILSMANIVNKEDELLQDISDEKWNLVCKEWKETHIQFNKQLFLFLYISMQRRLIRKAAFSLKPGLKDLSFTNINSVIQFLAKNKPGEIDLHDDLVALVASEDIYFGSKSKNWINSIYPQISQELEINVNSEYREEISPNWLFLIEKIDINDLESLQPENEFVAYVDCGKIQEIILLRNKKVGDRFQPLGLRNGTMKISDFFVNEKLIRSARAKWPLVTTEQGEIIWVPGFRLDQNFRVTNQTKKILKLSLLKTE